MLEVRRGPSADQLLQSAVWAAAALVTVAFGWILFDLVIGGIGRIDWGFLTTSVLDAGRAGGIGPVLVSTGLIVGIAMLVAAPLGLGTAMFLSELTRRGDRLGALVRRSLEVLAGVPSIVFGLFGNALFCKALGLGFSILSGGLTLACMALPLVIRATEEGFRTVPDSYRMGAAALGMSRTSTLFGLLLPVAAPGLAVGLVLGIGRAMAETAALIFTSGYVDRMPGSLLDSGRALSVHIFDLSMNVPGGTGNAYGSALVLIVSLLLVDGFAHWMTRRWLGRGIVAP
jgi:phosphate transport system permease protein